MRIFILISAVILFIACDQKKEKTTRDTSKELTEIGQINQIILADPDDPTGYYQRALYRARQDSLGIAIADMQRALRLDSTQAVYHETIGDLQYRIKDVKSAKSSFEKCIELDGENSECKFKKAEILLVLRRYQETIDLVNDALRLDETQAKGYYIKGWVYKELGDTTLSISSFRTAVEQDPEYYDAWVQLGLLHAGRQDDLALDYYNTAIELNPESTEAWYNKGMYCQTVGYDSLALDCYQEIMAFDPSNPTAYYNSGWVELELIGNNEKAIERFTRAVEILPKYYQAYYNRGLAYERTNDFVSARQDYERALVVQPDFELAANGLDRLDRKQ